MHASPLPDHWREVESPDSITEKYDPRPVSLAVRRDRDLGVHVLPASVDAPHSDRGRYRVGIVEGGPGEFEAAHRIATFSDRERALSAGREVIDAVEARVVEGDGDLAAVVESCRRHFRGD